jgi:hypothetical protein
MDHSVQQQRTSSHSSPSITDSFNQLEEHASTAAIALSATAAANSASQTIAAASSVATPVASGSLEDPLDVELEAAFHMEEDELDASSSEVINDDELTILEVRRALHIPLHPTRHAHQHHPRRIVHSPVNLLDEEDEDVLQTNATAATVSSSPTGSASDDDEGDVCAICLCAPTDLSVPSACSHPFCFACLEQWTKIQLAAIYRAQEEQQLQSIMQGFIAAVAAAKKTHPSCPLCKRDYSAIRRPVNSANPIAGQTAYEFTPIASILPPPNSFQQQPTLRIDNPNYLHNEHFRLAGEAALRFAVERAAGLRPAVLRDLLNGHARVNALLTAYPPYRDRLRQVRDDLISQVIATRDAWQRRNSVQDRMQRQRSQREEALAMDHGDGVQMPNPVPFMTDSNAYSQLMNRMSPYGSVLSLAFGAHSRTDIPPVTNPVLQLYREARYNGGITHYLGRMRLWSDLQVSHIPPQPDVIWALRMSGVGDGRKPFAEQAPVVQSATVAAASVPVAFAASSAAAANVLPASASTGNASDGVFSLPTLSEWLNTELTSLLSVRSESVTPDQHEHFLVNLVLSYLELLLNQLTLEEQKWAVEVQNRRSKPAHKRKRDKNVPHTVDISEDMASPVTSSANVGVNITSSSPQSSLPPLSTSFIPSYSSHTSSLHPIPAGAPTQLDGAEEAAAAESGDVVVVSSITPIPSGASATRTASSSPRADVISLDDEEEVSAAATGAVNPEDPETMALLHSTSTPRSLLPGGHMHSLFAFSAPLSSSVEYLFAKLQEFLRGFTGVFVHRLLLFILSRAYNHPEAGPRPGDPREVVTPAIAAARQRRESDLQQALQTARDRWQLSRDQAVGRIQESIRSNRRSPVARSDSSPIPVNEDPIATDTHSRSVSRRLARQRAQRASQLSTAATDPNGEGEQKESVPASARRTAHLTSGFVGSVFAAPSSVGDSSAIPRSYSSSSSSSHSAEIVESGTTTNVSGERGRRSAIGPTEQQYLDADAMLLTGMHSVKRPRISNPAT